MTMFEFRPGRGPSRLLVVDCGMLLGKTNSPGVDLTLPDWSHFADRLGDIDAVVLTHGHEDHIGALPYLLRERSDIPVYGSRLTLALVASKLDQHRVHNPDLRMVREGELTDVGPWGLEFFAVNHSIPDALAVAIRVGGADRAAHRRLQDGPDAAGRAAHRPDRLRPARRRGRGPAARRLDQRRGGRVHPVRARCRTRGRRRHRQGARAHHRGLLRLARAPGAAGAERGGRDRSSCRAGRTVDGAQHGHRARPRAAARPGRPAGRSQGGRGTAVAAGAADLDRLAGRAAVGAVADGQPRSPDRPDQLRTTRSCWRPR